MDGDYIAYRTHTNGEAYTYALRAYQNAWSGEVRSYSYYTSKNIEVDAMTVSMEIYNSRYGWLESATTSTYTVNGAVHKPKIEITDTDNQLHFTVLEPGTTKVTMQFAREDEPIVRYITVEKFGKGYITKYSTTVEQ